MKGCNIKIARLLFAAIIAVSVSSAFPENIDPYKTESQFAWGENAGWLNFQPSLGLGVQVAGDKLTGFVWAENIGWINLSCDTTSSCADIVFGVVNDGLGNLGGFAWAQNAGWINFDPKVPGDDTDYGVKIDPDGKFSGWAWGENIGWIKFDSAKIWNVQACTVTLGDLQNFAALWLQTGRTAAPADLNGSGIIDYVNYSTFAQYWLDFCPDGWQLK